MGDAAAGMTGLTSCCLAVGGGECPAEDLAGHDRQLCDDPGRHAAGLPLSQPLFPVQGPVDRRRTST